MGYIVILEVSTTLSPVKHIYTIQWDNNVHLPTIYIPVFSMYIIKGELLYICPLFYA